MVNSKEEAEGLLLRGIELGDIEKINLALSRGADVNAKDNLGGTALHLAAENAEGEGYQNYKKD